MTNATASGRRGILPAHEIRRLAEDGAIVAQTPFDADQIQPASLDLRLGSVAYRIRASFLPGPGATVAERVETLALHRMDLSEGAVLETGCVYLVPLQERLTLPQDLSALANPKSSTGRLDVFTRVIADTARAFDTVPEGYEGPLYAEISPRTFPVLVRPGSRLVQIRFRRGEPAYSDDTIARLHEREALVSTGTADIDNGLALSVDLTGTREGRPIGFRAKRHSALIDIDRKAALDVLDYWEPVWPRGDFILDPDEFYILASKEAVRVPPTHAAEMVPFNPLVGEFRVHYAGFFDPGFGHATGSGEGSRAVLEVRSHEVPFILEDGQTVGRLIYEELTDAPEEVYGAGIGSHYQRQGLKLSKHFRDYEP
ncbi:2'-deoxycytidine 5'-triphosphate deaminase [Kaustia mangrovi]|uniref:2'-deoxycytidine 5'-triphosphate deaminase n=1 Tax=Kaustia mangrovi TaxID=2593653 RepID=A0A7S8C571_9HYPH|nr:2'-deoxycytidine 5'-triphosphate deaminase [Kaustia mangrovi]QPC43578.1 2'-deoxycytidine 5'-triphosphate deaminase [Kaustia mangrovi]